MPHPGLLARAQRHRQFARTVVERHPLIGRSPAGARMLQALGLRSGGGRRGTWWRAAGTFLPAEFEAESPPVQAAPWVDAAAEPVSSGVAAPVIEPARPAIDPDARMARPLQTADRRSTPAVRPPSLVVRAVEAVRRLFGRSPAPPTCEALPRPETVRPVAPMGHTQVASGTSAPALARSGQGREAGSPPAEPPATSPAQPLRRQADGKRPPSETQPFDRGPPSADVIEPTRAEQGEDATVQPTVHPDPVGARASPSSQDVAGRHSGRPTDAIARSRARTDGIADSRARNDAIADSRARTDAPAAPVGPAPIQAASLAEVPPLGGSEPTATRSTSVPQPHAETAASTPAPAPVLVSPSAPAPDRAAPARTATSSPPAWAEERPLAPARPATSAPPARTEERPVAPAPPAASVSPPPVEEHRARRQLLPPELIESRRAAAAKTVRREPESEPIDPKTLLAPKPEGGDSPQRWLERLRAQAAAEAAPKQVVLGVPPSPERAGSQPVLRGVPGVGTRTDLPPTRQPPNRPLPPVRPPDSMPGETARPRFAPPRPTPAPTPLAQASRRFLRPLVGIDPAQARVFSGPEAERVTEPYAAEAVTAGNDIVLSPGRSEREPETLALLAHELTHVARRHSPGFVPPVARPGGTADTWTAAAGAGPDQEPLKRADEETVALRVESAVLRRAEQARSEPARSEPGLRTPETNGSETAPDRPGSSRGTVVPTEPSAESQTTVGSDGWLTPQPPESAPAGPPSPDREKWGLLPAPWEPLPEELSGSASEPAPAASFAPGPGGASVAETGVHLAARDRPRETEESAGGSATGINDGQGPDIDALARRVYEVLKRRLAAERRRVG
jgi:hypothetical protein